MRALRSPLVGSRVFFPRRCFTGSGEAVESPLYADAQPGDEIRAEAGAPGIGHTTFRVVQKTERGLRCIVIEDTVRELKPSEIV